VFDRLYRLERSRNTPGYGLGLSLVAAIAKLHQYTIELSDAKPGLSVTIHMPLTSARAAAPAEAPSLAPPSPAVEATATDRGTTA
jgi:signal transduction histidine kinase